MFKLDETVCVDARMTTVCTDLAKMKSSRCPTSTARASSRSWSPVRVRDMHGRGWPVFSFEFFPPKTDEGARALMATVADLKEAWKPDFVSVTYGPAAGRAIARSRSSAASMVSLLNENLEQEKAALAKMQTIGKRLAKNTVKSAA